MMMVPQAAMVKVIVLVLLSLLVEVIVGLVTLNTRNLPCTLRSRDDLHHLNRLDLSLFGQVKVNNLDNGNSIEIPSGSPLSLACVRSDMRLSFQCKQGTCQSCEVLLDGKMVRTCITKVPDKKSITIKKKPKK